MDSKSLEQQLQDAGLVEIKDPHFIIDLMYARANNMSGCAAYREIGLGNRAFVRTALYGRLLNLVPELEAMRLKMRICDAYRPPLAHTIMLKKVAIPGLFAVNYQLSNHCHGTAVDVCLTDLDGKNLEYPTAVDAYTPEIFQALQQDNEAPFRENLIRARHDYLQASPAALANRALLKDLMCRHGFEPIPHEWWHYNLNGFERYPVVEPACFKNYSL